jgi:hypothetical protein
LPPQFAYPAAFGDLLAAGLALAAIPAMAASRPSARRLVWISTSKELSTGPRLTLATVFGADAYMGPA